jgi:hypothetical protein
MNFGGDELPEKYYEPQDGLDFVCSTGSGMTTCLDIPPQFAELNYTVCRSSLMNPFKGTISFDNIGFAFIAIFQVDNCRVFYVCSRDR